MAKPQRTWTGYSSGNLAIPLAGTNGMTLIQDDGTAIGQGVVRFARLIGCVNVAVNNVVIGDPNIHAWHGVINCDFDKTLASIFTYPGGGDENEDAWLWREPISIWPTGQHLLGTGDDFIISVRFDWQFRGGKGSQNRPESKCLYVFSYVSGVGPTITINMRAHGLFTAT